MKAITDCSKAIQGVSSGLGEQQIKDLRWIFHSEEDTIQAAQMELDNNNNATAAKQMAKSVCGFD